MDGDFWENEGREQADKDMQEYLARIKRESDARIAAFHAALNNQKQTKVNMNEMYGPSEP